MTEIPQTSFLLSDCSAALLVHIKVEGFFLQSSRHGPCLSLSHTRSDRLESPMNRTHVFRRREEAGALGRNPAREMGGRKRQKTHKIRQDEQNAKV